MYMREIPIDVYLRGDHHHHFTMLTIDMNRVGKRAIKLFVKSPRQMVSKKKKKRKKKEKTPKELTHITSANTSTWYLTSPGSLGMLLGYHLLWSTTANVVGTDEQQESVQEVIIRNNFFVGGAVNPRDNDLKITDDGNEIVFHGSKNFNTGGGYFTYSLHQVAFH